MLCLVGYNDTGISTVCWMEGGRVLVDLGVFRLLLLKTTNFFIICKAIL